MGVHTYAPNIVHQQDALTGSVADIDDVGQPGWGGGGAPVTTDGPHLLPTTDLTNFYALVFPGNEAFTPVITSLSTITFQNAQFNPTGARVELPFAITGGAPGQIYIFECMVSGSGNIALGYAEQDNTTYYGYDSGAFALTNTPTLRRFEYVLASNSHTLFARFNDYGATSLTVTNVKIAKRVTSGGGGGGQTAVPADTDNPDTDWMLASSLTAGATLRVGFPTPYNNPRPGAGLQTFTATLRKGANGAGRTGVPTVTLSVYENGVLRASGTSQAINSATSQTFTLTWDASVLSDPTGAGVECLVDAIVGGSGNQRMTADVGMVSWTCDYLPVIHQGVATVQTLSGTVASVKARYKSGTAIDADSGLTPSARKVVYGNAQILAQSEYNLRQITDYRMDASPELDWNLSGEVTWVAYSGVTGGHPVTYGEAKQTFSTTNVVVTAKKVKFVTSPLGSLSKLTVSSTRIAAIPIDAQYLGRQYFGNKYFGIHFGRMGKTGFLWDEEANMTSASFVNAFGGTRYRRSISIVDLSAVTAFARGVFKRSILQIFGFSNVVPVPTMQRAGKSTVLSVSGASLQPARTAPVTVQAIDSVAALTGTARAVRPAGAPLASLSGVATEAFGTLKGTTDVVAELSQVSALARSIWRGKVTVTETTNVVPVPKLFRRSTVPIIDLTVVTSLARRIGRGQVSLIETSTVSLTPKLYRRTTAQTIAELSNVTVLAREISRGAVVVLDQSTVVLTPKLYRRSSISLLETSNVTSNARRIGRSTAPIASTSNLASLGKRRRPGAAVVASLTSVSSLALFIGSGKVTVASTTSVATLGKRLRPGITAIPATSALVTAARLLGQVRATMPSSTAVAVQGRRRGKGAASIPGVSAVASVGKLRAKGQAALPGLSAVATAPVRTTLTGTAIPALSTLEAAAYLIARGVTAILDASVVEAIGKLIAAGATSVPALSLLAAQGARYRSAGASISPLSSVSVQALSIGRPVTTIPALSDVDVVGTRFRAVVSDTILGTSILTASGNALRLAQAAVVGQTGGVALATRVAAGRASLGASTAVGVQGLRRGAGQVNLAALSALGVYGARTRPGSTTLETLSSVSAAAVVTGLTINPVPVVSFATLEAIGQRLRRAAASIQPTTAVQTTPSRLARAQTSSIALSTVATQPERTRAAEAASASLSGGSAQPVVAYSGQAAPESSTQISVAAQRFREALAQILGSTEILVHEQLRAAGVTSIPGLSTVFTQPERTRAVQTALSALSSTATHALAIYRTDVAAQALSIVEAAAERTRTADTSIPGVSHLLTAATRTARTGVSIQGGSAVFTQPERTRPAAADLIGTSQVSTHALIIGAAQGTITAVTELGVYGARIRAAEGSAASTSHLIAIGDAIRNTILNTIESTTNLQSQANRIARGIVTPDGTSTVASIAERTRAAAAEILAGSVVASHAVALYVAAVNVVTTSAVTAQGDRFRHVTGTIGSATEVNTNANVSRLTHAGEVAAVSDLSARTVRIAAGVSQSLSHSLLGVHPERTREAFAGIAGESSTSAGAVAAYQGRSNLYSPSTVIAQAEKILQGFAYPDSATTLQATANRIAAGVTSIHSTSDIWADAQAGSKEMAYAYPTSISDGSAVAAAIYQARASKQPTSGMSATATASKPVSSAILPASQLGVHGARQAAARMHLDASTVVVASPQRTRPAAADLASSTALMVGPVAVFSGELLPHLGVSSLTTNGKRIRYTQSHLIESVASLQSDASARYRSVAAIMSSSTIVALGTVVRRSSVAVASHGAVSTLARAIYRDRIDIHASATTTDNGLGVFDGDTDFIQGVSFLQTDGKARFRESTSIYSLSAMLNILPHRTAPVSTSIQPFTELRINVTFIPGGIAAHANSYSSLDVSSKAKLTGRSDVYGQASLVASANRVRYGIISLASQTGVVSSGRRRAIGLTSILSNSNAVVTQKAFKRTKVPLLSSSSLIVLATLKKLQRGNVTVSSQTILQAAQKLTRRGKSSIQPYSALITKAVRTTLAQARVDASAAVMAQGQRKARTTVPLHSLTGLRVRERAIYRPGTDVVAVTGTQVHAERARLAGVIVASQLSVEALAYRVAVQTASIQQGTLVDAYGARVARTEVVMHTKLSIVAEPRVRDWRSSSTSIQSTSSVRLKPIRVRQGTTAISQNSLVSEFGRLQFPIDAAVMLVGV